jgi:hypothetical protein
MEVTSRHTATIARPGHPGQPSPLSKYVDIQSQPLLDRRAIPVARFPIRPFIEILWLTPLLSVIYPDY